MAYPPAIITEITVIGVADPGVPNQERVLLRPMEGVALNGFGIAVGVPGPNGGAYALYDNVFWFPAMIVSPPSWIIVFTGRGTNTETTLPSGERAHLFYWLRPYTIFHQPNLVPVLFKAGMVVVGPRIPA